MSTRNTARNGSLVGVAASIGLAVVTYRISTGTGGGENHGPAWCFFGFAILQIILWNYLFYCATRECPGPGNPGHEECINRCFLKFFILELLAIIALLICLLITGPQW